MHSTSLLSEDSESDSLDETSDRTSLLHKKPYSPANLNGKYNVKNEPNNNHYDKTNAPISKQKQKKILKDVKIKSVKDGLKLLEEHDLAKKRRAIWYQVMAISAVAMLHGMSVVPAFWNSLLLNIYEIKTQSVTLGLVVVCYIISCFISPAITNRLPLKLTLVIGCLSASAFTAARLFPKLYIMIPASIFMGITLAPFYSTIFKYICNLSTQYEGYQGYSYKDSVYTFTSVCFGWICCSPAWLSLLHIIIYNIVGGDQYDSVDYTRVDCGFSYIWDWSENNKQQTLSPEVHSIQALLGSCLVCTLGGILLILIVLQNYKVPEYHTHTPKHQSSCSFFAEFLVETNHLLLIPIYLGTAAFEIFCYTLFGQTFVTCNFGSDAMYQTMLCMSMVAALTSIPASAAYRKVSGAKVMIPMFSLSVVILLVLSFGGYMPYALHFVMISILGILSFVLTSYVTATTMCKCSTKPDISLCFYHMARSFVFLLVFVTVKLQGDNSTITIAIVGMTAIGLFCYVLLELRLKMLEKDEKADVHGSYVLLDKAPWIPEIDPTTVKSTEKLDQRMYEDDE